MSLIIFVIKIFSYRSSNYWQYKIKIVEKWVDNFLLTETIFIYKAASIYYSLSTKFYLNKLKYFYLILGSSKNSYLVRSLILNNKIIIIYINKYDFFELNYGNTNNF